MPKKKSRSKAHPPREWWEPVLEILGGIGETVIPVLIQNWLNKPSEPDTPEDAVPDPTRRQGTRSHTPRRRAPKIIHWWKVLGISENSDPLEIKKAFRTQMMLTHPDKVAHLSVKLQKAAEKEAKKLNQAYQEAMSQFGTE